MAKDAPNTVAEVTKDTEARSVDTSVDGVQFESPVRRVENVGEVSDEKAKEINGYKGHDKIATKVEEDQEARGRKRDDKTETGAKKF